jgi:hypothetical protein
VLRFRSENETSLTIEAGDLPAFDEALQVEEAALGDHEFETVFTIAVASFAEGYKWRLSEGDAAVFTASIEDPVFRARIDNGEPFRKGDMLRVRMRSVQTQRGDKLHVERSVVEVVEHIGRAVQYPLASELPADDDVMRE